MGIKSQLCTLLLILSVSSQFSSCNNAKDIVLDSDVIEEYGDTSRIPYSSYIFRHQTLQQKGYWYRVSPEKPELIVIDTCFTGQTIFDSKIIVFNKCDNNVGVGPTAMNDDGINGCGKQARLVYYLTSPIFVFITGATQLDTGVFGLRIAKMPTRNNTSPSTAKHLSVPTSVEVFSIHETSSHFFTFYMPAIPVEISTCHKITDTSTILTLDANTPNEITKTSNCPNRQKGSFIEVFGDNYSGANQMHSIRVTAERRGRYVLTIKFKSSETIPITIRELPFYHISKPSGEKSRSCGEYPAEQGTWYVILGTGEDYLISTCQSSVLGENIGTTVEVFENGIDKVSDVRCQRDSFGCGIHGRIMRKFEKNKEYFIKTSCQVEGQCSATLLVQRILRSSEECRRPIILDVGQGGIVSHSKVSSLSHPCQPISIFGSWYKLRIRENVNYRLYGGVIDGFKTYGSLISAKTCRGPCEEKEGVFVKKLYKGGEYLFIVRTSSLLVSGVSLYVVPERETSCNEIVNETPFSVIGILENRREYYTFEGDGSEYIIETCGVDTQVDTIVTVFSSCVSTLTPIAMNDDSLICGDSASFLKQKFNGKFIVAVDVSHKADKSVGPYRLSVYKDIKSPNDVCHNPLPIKEGTRFIYTYNNRYTTFPGIQNVQSKGEFFKVDTGNAILETCNSIVKSRIEVFSSDCQAIIPSRKILGYCRNGEKVNVRRGDIVFVGGYNAMDMGLIQIEMFEMSLWPLVVLFVFIATTGAIVLFVIAFDKIKHFCKMLCTKNEKYHDF
ncbi:hypothetical protein EIN_065730 [Entamoeba invadens IP1]|uniref:Uncharacterized protein n=1 Tax=Entamoeba invadens IP1 TaxID=370355 RepID=A0A0A1U080_ENTIV|nr:hypothetical protein EIN_065730 [Entamoeba invadens IP1]ELP84298.1 hypothetical protein EIN_065730 [Entamoeba invadens IP1]|eukprot:XP_004183644.1 hypothetical protein EIN_065730 [Entamoeba invadens IP1]